MPIPKINLMPQGSKEGRDYKDYYVIIISVIIILGIVVAYVVLSVYGNSLSANQSELEKKIKEQDDLINNESDKNIANFQKRLKYISDTLKVHIRWTNLFSFMEANTLKNVKFDNFEGRLSEKGETVEINVDVAAPTFTDAAKQILVFRNLQSVDKTSTDPVINVSFRDFKVNKDGDVSFVISLVLKKDILYDGQE